MFVKMVLRDSFRELKVTLKDPKILMFSLMMIVNVFVVFKFYLVSGQLLAFIPLAILNLFFIAFQYSNLGKIIHSDKKNIVKNKSLGFKNKLFRLIEELFFLILIGLFLVLIFTTVSAIILIVARIWFGEYILFFKLNDFYKPLFLIFSFVFMLRTILCIPLCILDDTLRPIRLSLELTKGYFWKLTIVSFLIPLALIYLFKIITTFLLTVLNLNFIIANLITLPFIGATTILTILIIINSMYYLMNRDLLNVRKIKSKVEVI